MALPFFDPDLHNLLQPHLEHLQSDLENVIQPQLGDIRAGLENVIQPQLDNLQAGLENVIQPHLDYLQSILPFPIFGDYEETKTKIVARCLGVIGGACAVVLGLSNIFLFSISCAYAGLLQMIVGGFVIFNEIPQNCLPEKHTKLKNLHSSTDTENLKYRGIIYISLGIPPMVIAPGFNSILGSGLIVSIGAYYIVLHNRFSRTDR